MCVVIIKMVNEILQKIFETRKQITNIYFHKLLSAVQ